MCSMKRNNEMVFVGGWLLGAVVLVMVLGTWAEARMYSFADYGDFSTSRSLRMAFGDNLLVRVGGVDRSLLVAGYLTGSWHLGLTNADGYIVGWAKNSSKAYTGYEGWLTGRYSFVLGDGGRPSHAFLVYDSADSGSTHGWDIIDGQIGSVQDLLDGDLFFDETDILFGQNELRGDLGGIELLPAYIVASGGASAILPHMVVVTLPQHSTIEDLLILCDYWLEDCSSLNDHCDGADNWNSDGKVNFLDFAELASRW
jgi:hypothetical protein